jgi:hypothetical protein
MVTSNQRLTASMPNSAADLTGNKRRTGAEVQQQKQKKRMMQTGTDGQ